ncbi:class I adenylate-forming enzyme family protein [Sporolactobacillus vineae]|uniref:class I adenylate-forming enzyme family protein n=1 Tax=Sporolactobacillus vineae TaxID=444463 RepID=UPI000289CC86|nr:AMP-binding protein [Sporolactobacillus vineae]
MTEDTMTLSALLHHQADVFSEKTLFYYQNRSFSYGQVDEQASHVAAALKRLGVKKSDRILVGLDNTPEELVAFAAVARLGALYIPVYTAFQVPEIAYFLHDSQAVAVIGSPDWIEKVKKCDTANRLKWVIQMGGTVDTSVIAWNELIQEPDRWSETVAGDDPLAIYYTSGTTGHPKGAVLLNQRFLHNAFRLKDQWHYTHDDVSVNTLSYTHIFAPICEWFPLMACGGRFVLRNRFSPRGVLDDIRNYQATFLCGVPSMYRLILDELMRKRTEQSFASMRFALVGGAPMPVPLQQEIETIMGIPFVQGYGQTESGPVVSIELLDRPDGKHPGTCGTNKMFEDVQLRVIDQRGKNVPPGEVGELLVHSPDIMAGYWNRPEITKKTIRDGWLHTGDLARTDSDGYYYLVDRKKDLIITGGQNVYPAEVEKVLDHLSAIKDAAVIGLPDPVRGESVAAYISLKEDAILTEQQVKNYCKNNLAEFKRPRQIHFIKSLPKTVSGKIRKGLLKAQILDSPPGIIRKSE